MFSERPYYEENIRSVKLQRPWTSLARISAQALEFLTVPIVSRLHVYR